MPIIGTSTIGDTSSSASIDNKRANKVTLSCNAIITSMSFYLDGQGTGTGSQLQRGIIYDDDGTAGVPGTLLDTTNEMTITDGQSAGWITAAFPSPKVYAPGDYYIGQIDGANGSTIRLYYVASGTDYNNGDTYVGGAASPFGTYSTRTRTYSWYATYNISPPIMAANPASMPIPTVTATSSWWNLGNSTPFASTATQAADGKQCIRVQATASGDVTTLKAYLDGSGGGLGSQVFKGVIYSDNAGAPNALLATGSEFSVAKDAAAAWKTSTISLTITKDAYYWIGIIKGTTTQVARWYAEVVTGSSQKNDDTYSDGPTDPFGTPVSSNNNYNVYLVVGPLASTSCTVSVLDAFKATNASILAGVIVRLDDKTESPVMSANAATPTHRLAGPPDQIVVERKYGEDGSYSVISTRAYDSDLWDDPGPFTKGGLYYYRVKRINLTDESNYSEEAWIEYLGSIDITLQPRTALYTASFLTPEVFVNEDILPGVMGATATMRPVRLLYSSIFSVVPMTTDGTELTFYYAWGTGPSHTDHVPNPFLIQAGVLAPVVVIPKTISTTVVLQGAARAGGAGLVMNTKKFPDRMPADAILAGGDDAHDIDGFIVTVKKTATADNPYTMGTTKTTETVHYISPDKREFKLYGVPADARFRFAVQAYRIVDPDINAAGVINSTLVQYPASTSDALSADSVNYTGLINSVAAATVTTGAAGGTSSWAVVESAFSSGKLVSSWQPSSATAVPYNFSGLFGNSSYLGYVTRGADPASPLWKTFMDNGGNFYLGGSNGSSSGLAWASSSNDLSINFDNTTTGGITMSTKGYIKAGQTAYNTGTGFFLGYSTDAVKFSLGTSTQGLTWDGTTLTVKGTVEVTNPEDFGNKNWTTQPQTSDAYNVGDLWLDTTATPPKIWKCITGKAAGAAFDYAHWTISNTRVYNAQPTTPYALGDLWLDGTTSPPNTWQCTTARASGSFVAGDWTKIGDSTEAKLNSGTTTISGGTINVTGSGGTGGKIYSGGKTVYNSSTAGFFLGWDSSLTKYVFGIGDASKYLRWDGSSLSFSGTLVGTDGTFSGTLSASCLVGGTLSLGNSVTISSTGFSSPYLTANASGATFSGTLSAAGGTFSGTIAASQVTSGTMSAARISGGTLTGVTINALTSCTIGTTLYVGGEIFLTNGSPGTYRDIHFDNTNTNMIKYSSVGVAVIGSDGASLTSGSSEVYAISGEGVNIKPYIAMGSSSGPQIRYGSAPTEGDTTSYALGTLLLSTGGSLWTVWSDGGTSKWTKIWTKASHV